MPIKTSLNSVKSIEKLSVDLRNLIRDTTGTTKEEKVSRLQTKFEHLATKLRTHTQLVKKELSEREIDKLSSFKDSVLKINLSKFGGFDSKIDIYSFQTEFEKLHKRTTPSIYLPDLLRNNYLEDPALSIVKAETDINEIWRRLKSSFGNTNILLNKKLEDISNLESIWRIKAPSKIAESLSKIIALMKNLMSLCKQHKIEAKLYNSDCIQRLYKLLGDMRTTRWFEFICDREIEGKELWTELINFLEKDLKVQQQKQLISSSDPSKVQRAHPSQYEPSNPQLKCAICNSFDHQTTSGPQGGRLVQYFACREFFQMSPAERFTILKNKNLCYQCLYPGAHLDTGKHQEGKCQRQFICQHDDHNNSVIKKHILVCDEHKRDPENVRQLDIFKEKCISRRYNMPDYSKNISNFISVSSFQSRSPNDSVDEAAIFKFQEITINHKPYLIFFDSGCDDFIVRKESVKSLGTSAQLQCKLPVNLGGVGDVTTSIKTNVYAVTIPTFDGFEATLTGISLDKITSTFPTYHLNSQVEQDIHNAFKSEGGDPSTLPKLPPTIGGDVDFMIGIKYLRYHPKLIFQMPSGLSIYQSVFRNKDGSRGVIGGPHQVFTMINNQHHSKKDFLSQQFKLFQSGYQINPDIILKSRSFHVSKNLIPCQQSIKTVSLHEEMELDEKFVTEPVTSHATNSNPSGNIKIKDTKTALRSKRKIQPNKCNPTKSLTMEIVNQISIPSSQSSKFVKKAITRCDQTRRIKPLTMLLCFSIFLLWFCEYRISSTISFHDITKPLSTNDAFYTDNSDEYHYNRFREKFKPFVNKPLEQKLFYQNSRTVLSMITGIDQNSTEPPIVQMILIINTETLNARFSHLVQRQYLPRNNHRPKCFKYHRYVTLGDIAPLLTIDSPIHSTYQYGIIRELFPGRDSKIRKVKVAYKNHNENVFRETSRAVRELIVIHQVDEVDLVDGLNEMFELSK